MHQRLRQGVARLRPAGAQEASKGGQEAVGGRQEQGQRERHQRRRRHGVTGKKKEEEQKSNSDTMFSVKINVKKEFTVRKESTNKRVCNVRFLVNVFQPYVRDAKRTIYGNVSFRNKKNI